MPFILHYRPIISFTMKELYGLVIINVNYQILLIDNPVKQAILNIIDYYVLVNCCYSHI